MTTMISSKDLDRTFNLEHEQDFYVCQQSTVSIHLQEQKESMEARHSKVAEPILGRGLSSTWALIDVTTGTETPTIESPLSPQGVFRIVSQHRSPLFPFTATSP